MKARSAAEKKEMWKRKRENEGDVKKFDAARDVETAKTQAPALQTLINNAGVIASTRLKFDLVLCDIAPDTAPRTWNSKKIERVLDLIDCSPPGMSCVM